MSFRCVVVQAFVCSVAHDWKWPGTLVGTANGFRGWESMISRVRKLLLLQRSRVRYCYLGGNSL